MSSGPACSRSATPRTTCAGSPTACPCATSARCCSVYSGVETDDRPGLDGEDRNRIGEIPFIDSPPEAAGGGRTPAVRLPERGVGARAGGRGRPRGRARREQERLLLFGLLGGRRRRRLLARRAR